MSRPSHNATAFEERDSRVAEWTAWQVTKGLAVVLGVGALIAWWFREFLVAYLPRLNPARVGRAARRRDLPLPSGERFVVLIADLQGDDDEKSQTRHVAAALAPYRGLDVQRIGPGPEWDVGSRDAFEAKARALLAERLGDVLLSGDVAAAGKGLRLRILPSDSSISARRETPDGRRPGEYTLTETGLPLDFDQDFNAMLVALVAASVAPATERQGQYLVDVLEPVAGRLKHLCSNVPDEMDHDQRGGLWRALGLASAVMGEQKGESGWLDQAVAAFRAALEVRTRERVPLDWAMTQNDLGTALWNLGAREDGTVRLKEAVTAFRAALEVRTRERIPLQWARTQNNLGNALNTLGEREDGTARLKQAVEAYRAALEVWTRERAPLDWAAAQNNLGRALGEREDGTERLEQAIAAYRAAIEVRTPARVPLDWAKTQNNLGNALRALGEHEDGTERLDQAVAAYRAGLKVFRGAGARHYVGIAEANLGRAEALLAQRQGRSAAE
jgi:tetratricopeptide (TPR) repeat protein